MHGIWYVGCGPDYPLIPALPGNLFFPAMIFSRLVKRTIRARHYALILSHRESVMPVTGPANPCFVVGSFLRKGEMHPMK